MGNGSDGGGSGARSDRTGPGSSKGGDNRPAWKLIAAAWESRGEQRYALARQALSAYPDCADAYVLLAEEAYDARDTARMRELFEQGVHAGERDLGPRFMVEEAGHFWHLSDTRGYMRAHLGLANALWEEGRQWEAIAYYAGSLRLNPDDNQGVRYMLAQCLLEENAQEMLGRLLHDYRWDTGTRWRYTRALWLFRGFADCQRCNSALTRAISENPFVPEYLLGYAEVPPDLSPWASRGSREEASHYARDAKQAWQQPPSALDWLHRRWRSRALRSARSRLAKE